MLPAFKNVQDFDLFAHLLSDHLKVPANKIRTAIARINHFNHVAALRSALDKQASKPDMCSTNASGSSNNADSYQPGPASLGTLLPGQSVTFVLDNGGNESNHPLIGQLFDMASSPDLNGLHVSAASRSHEIMRLELLEAILSDDSRCSDEKIEDMDTIVSSARVTGATTLKDLGVAEVPDEW